MRVCPASAFVLLAFAAAGVAQQPEPESPTARRLLAEHRALERSRAVLRGRCVDGATGAPLAGCRVVVESTGHGHWPGPDHERLAALLRPPVVLTGDDGSFELRAFAHDDFAVALRITCDGRWPRTEGWWHFWPGQQVQLGDVRLSVGVPAAFEVRDEDGQPVPGLSLAIERMPFYLHAEAAGVWANRTVGLGNDRAQHSVSLRSDEAGLATSAEALPPGRFDLRIGDGPYELLEPQRITIEPADEEPDEPQVVLVRRRPSITGLVVDAAGAPIGGVELEARVHQGVVGTARSGDDGAFCLYRVEQFVGEVKLQVTDAGLFAPGRRVTGLAWGDDGVRVVLQRAVTLDVEVVVVVADTGEPVEGFSMSRGGEWRRFEGHGVAGAVRWEGVALGRKNLTVVLDDPAQGPATVNFVASEGMQRLRVELQRLRPMLVQVLDDAGVPVVGCEVRVVRPDGEWRHTRLSDLRGVTDGGGQCILYGSEQLVDRTLVVHRGEDEVHRETGVTFGREHGTREIRLRAK